MNCLQAKIDREAASERGKHFIVRPIALQSIATAQRPTLKTRFLDLLTFVKGEGMDHLFPFVCYI